MRETDLEGLAEWLRNKPEIIKRLADEFPPGDAFTWESQVFYVVGYRESQPGEHPALLCSEIDPCEDYEGAVASIEPFCAHCVRQTRKERPN